jgi:hypothetical protein
MSEQPDKRREAQQPREAEQTQAESPDYGSLSVEDDPSGTVNPADLAGTGKPEDEAVGYQPEATEADSQP